MLTIDREDYKINRSLIQKAYTEKGLAKTLELSTVSGVPLLATLGFVSELELSEDESQRVEEYIASLERFYRTKLVRGTK